MRIGGQLVYLVEKNERIHHLRLSQRAYDASGHRADIGLAVAANVSLVAHSAERNAHKAAVHSLGDRAGDRGFSGAGRAYEADNLMAQLGIQLLYRKVFKDPLLYLFESVVVAIEYPAGKLNIHPILGALVPRQLEADIEIVAEDSRLCRVERGLCELFRLLDQLCLYLLGQRSIAYLVHVLGYLVVVLVVQAARSLAVSALAQLGVYHLELLAQIVFSLSAVDIRLYLLPYIGLGFDDLGLARKNDRQRREPHDRIVLLEHSLLIVHVHQHAGGDKVAQQSRRGYRVNRQRKLGRYLRHAGNELVEGSPHLAHYRLNRRIVVRVDLYRLSEYGGDRYPVLIRFCREQARAAYALYDHSRAVLAETHELLYCTDAAYLANIVLYLLAVAVTVAQRAADSLLVRDIAQRKECPTALAARLLAGADSTLGAELEADGYSGENNRPVKRRDGKRVGIYFFCIFRHFIFFRFVFLSPEACARYHRMTAAISPGLY